MADGTQPLTTRAALREWFSPPRAHGEVIEDRVVSFVELFYDLVFVVLIAKVAHTLAGDVSWIGVRNFVVVFGMIWMAWINGSLYHELHGGEDGRSRTYLFTQMVILVVLSVYAAHAADDPVDGRRFAIVYVVLLLVLGWQWFEIRRYDTAELAAMTTRYVIGVGITAVLVAISAVVDDPDVRLGIWAFTVAFALFGALVQSGPGSELMDEVIRITESMAERFGLFTIIVLGEVVVGVADGLEESSRTALAVLTGVLALNIGFGFWWNYFDLVGRRVPQPGSVRRMTWIYGHFPLALSIAAAGVGMVSLIEHADDGRTPAGSAWLIGLSTAAIALSLAAIASTMPPHPGRRLAPHALVVAAGVACVLAALRPAPWLLALGLYASLSLVWADLFIRHARAGTNIVSAD